MARIEIFWHDRFSREAFDPAQLREGAISTGGIGGCPVAGFGILTPTTFALAPHGSSPSKAGLRRRARSKGKTEMNNNAAAQVRHRRINRRAWADASSFRASLRRVH